MSIVAEYTREKWEESGGWAAIETWVDGVVLLWQEGDEEPIDEATYWSIYCGQLPPRTCPYQFFRRDDDGVWWLEEEGDNHALDRVMNTAGRNVQRCPHCRWRYDVDPARPGCPSCGPALAAAASVDMLNCGEPIS